MKTAAAKGRSSSWRLIAAGAALLVAVPAAAGRFTPPAANALLEKQGSSSILSARPVVDIAPACAFAPASRFSSALTPASPPARSQKLASGLSRSGVQCNLWRICTLGPKSWWIVWKQGNTLRYAYDAFGQLTGIEDDLGRRYRLEYYDDPKPESEGGDGPRYGLLRKVTDFATRTVEYEYDTERRLTKVKLPEVTTTAPEYSQYAFTGSNRPTIEYRYDPSSNVTSSETATTAILHGQFATLRLEGFEQPGSDVLRARFEYETVTGRAKTVAFPDAGDHNDSGSGVQWAIAYPSEASTAAPATKATVTAPWQHDVEYTVENGRTKEVKETGVEALAVGDATPPAAGEIPVKTITTAFEYTPDGRVTSVRYADGSRQQTAYPSGGDRLAWANIVSAAIGSLALTVDYTALHTVSAVASCPGAGAAQNLSNIPITVTDGAGRKVSTPLALFAGSTRPEPEDSPWAVCDAPEGSFGASVQFDRFGRATAAASLAAGQTPAATVELRYGASPEGKPGAGLLEGITAEGATQQLTRDDRGNVTAIVDAYGRSELSNDEWDREVASRSGLGAGGAKEVNAQAQRAFDAAGRLVRERVFQTGVGWVETRFEYNARDQITSATRTSVAGPTAGGGLVEATVATGFDSFGRPVTATSPAGIVTTTSYDSAGRVKSVRVGEGGERRTGYDEQGRVVWATDGDEGVWRGTYDGRGLLVEEQLPTGAVLERSFDAGGALTGETVYADAARSAILEKTLYQPTALGMPSQIKQAISLAGGEGESDEYLTTDLSYDAMGRLVQVAENAPREAGRFPLARTYEAGTGRLLSESDAAGNRTTFEYSGSGPLPSAVVTTEQGAVPLTLRTVLSHDALGRVIASETDGTHTELVLDELGNVLSESTGGIGFESTYDGAGLVRQVTRKGIGLLSRFGYDADGRLLVAETQRQSGTESATYRYNTSGQLITRTRPGSIPEVFSYYPDGTLKRHSTRLTNAGGAPLALTYHYSAGNQLLWRETNRADFNAALPAGLADVDFGDAYGWDALSRPTRAAARTGVEETSLDPTSSVIFDGYDPRGLPARELVGLWAGAGALERTWDGFGRAAATITPPYWHGENFAGVFASYDVLDRVATIHRAIQPDQGAVGPGFGAEYTWSGAGRLARSQTSGEGALKQDAAFAAVGGRLSTQAFSVGEVGLGQLVFGWDPTRDTKTARFAPPSGSPRNLTLGLNWSWSSDAAKRLSGATSGALSSRRAIAQWDYSYGRADELLSIHSADEGLDVFSSGPEGRPVARDGASGPEAFAYDGEGRRIEDERFAYTWDWRGRLVQVDVKGWPHHGERVAYQYDALGRLISRTHLGAVPEGGTDEERPFIAKRVFLWDGDALLSEAGLNYADQVIWRAHYTPGPVGLDDSPQVLVQTGLVAGAPQEKLYAFVRDELATVIGVVEDVPPVDEKPRLLARYLYTPYGEGHAEAGPELVEIVFDPAVTTSGGQTQAPPVEGETVAGAVVVRTTLALEPAAWPAGVRIEAWDEAAGGWRDAMAEFAIGQADGAPDVLHVLRVAGWPKEHRYRITLLPALEDEFARPIQLPGDEASGVAIVLGVPDDGTTPPAYARSFPFLYDSGVAASNTLDEAFPGGQTHLYAGMWTDPVTGLSYARERWLDTRNAAWMSPDPLDSIDSVNLYAYCALQPSMYTDPLGLELQWHDWFGIAYDAYGSSMAPTPENAKRGLGGAVGTMKFFAGTAYELVSLGVDLALMNYPGNSAANDRMAQRLEGLGEMVAHPINAAGGSISRMVATVEAHEAAGEYFASGMEAGEWGAAAGATVLGAAEGGAGLARLGAGGARSLRSALSFDFVEQAAAQGLRAGAAEGIAELAPRFVIPGSAIGPTIRELRAAGFKDSHHIIQGAAVRDLPGYSSLDAPGIQLSGPSTLVGSPHYAGTMVQRLRGGGTYGAERRIAYRTLRRGGYTPAQAQAALARADAYFGSLGVTRSTPLRIPGNRNRP